MTTVVPPRATGEAPVALPKYQSMSALKSPMKAMKTTEAPVALPKQHSMSALKSPMKTIKKTVGKVGGAAHKVEKTVVRGATKVVDLAGTGATKTLKGVGKMQSKLMHKAENAVSGSKAEKVDHDAEAIRLMNDSYDGSNRNFEMDDEYQDELGQLPIAKELPTPQKKTGVSKKWSVCAFDDPINFSSDDEDYEDESPGKRSSLPLSSSDHGESAKKKSKAPKRRNSFGSMYEAKSNNSPVAPRKKRPGKKKSGSKKDAGGSAVDPAATKDPKSPDEAPSTPVQKRAGKVKTKKPNKAKSEPITVFMNGTGLGEDNAAASGSPKKKKKKQISASAIEGIDDSIQSVDDPGTPGTKTKKIKYIGEKKNTKRASASPLGEKKKSMRSKLKDNKFSSESVLNSREETMDDSIQSIEDLNQAPKYRTLGSLLEEEENEDIDGSGHRSEGFLVKAKKKAKAKNKQKKTTKSASAHVRSTRFSDVDTTSAATEATDAVSLVGSAEGSTHGGSKPTDATASQQPDAGERASANPQPSFQSRFSVFMKMNPFKNDSGAAAKDESRTAGSEAETSSTKSVPERTPERDAKLGGETKDDGGSIQPGTEGAATTIVSGEGDAEPQNSGSKWNLAKASAQVIHRTKESAIFAKIFDEEMIDEDALASGEDDDDDVYVEGGAEDNKPPKHKKKTPVARFSVIDKRLAGIEEMELGLAKEKEELEKEREKIAFERESLELQLDEETQKNEVLLQRVRQLETQLEEQKLLGQEKQEQIELLAENEALRAQLRTREVDDEQRIMEKNAEIEELKDAIAKLKLDDNVGEFAVNPFDGKSKQRLHGELLQAISKLSERDALISKQSQQIDQLTKELMSLKDGSILQKLKETVQVTSVENTELKAKLEKEKTAADAKIKSKDETISFLMEELGSLKKAQSEARGGMLGSMGSSGFLSPVTGRNDTAKQEENMDSSQHSISAMLGFGKLPSLLG